MNITILGYYGYGSLGDEIVLKMLVDDIRKTYQSCDITVLTSHSTIRGVHSLGRYNIPAVIAQLAKTDLLILGGGTLIQDTTSRRSLIYYCEMIKLAHRLGAKVYLMGGGIGRVNCMSYAVEALSLCDKISVRDKRSKHILDLIGIESTLSCDRILSATHFERRNGEGYFTVSVRKCASDTKLDADSLKKALSPFCDKLTPVFVSMQDSYDLSLCRHLAKQLGGAAVSPKSLDELLYLQSGAEFAVGMRLHFLLSAMISDVPTVALSYDVKTSALGIPTFSCSDIPPQALENALKSADKAFIPSSCRALCRRDTLAIGELIYGIKPIEFSGGA